MAAMSLGGLPEPAHAQGVPPPNCRVSPIDPTVVNCTGDLSDGVALNDGAGPFRTLNVFALTADIAPPGSSGVVFTSDNSVTLNVDTGAFRIVTTADDAMGVHGGSVNGGVSINARADIATSGNQSHGIAAETQTGDIDIQAFGSISTSGDALGPADGAFGIFAVSLLGDIEIWSDSDITTTGILGAGIFAETSGAALVTSNGNIWTSAEDAAGIAVAAEAGAIVVSTGDITTFGDMAPGITVISDGDAVVVSTGNITTTGGGADGIQVMSMFGTAMVVSFGNVSATGLGSAGIYAWGSDAVVLNFGSVVGGPCCAGVIMDADGLNTLINFGTISAGLADSAIDLLGADNVVENFGTVTGNVILSDGFGAQGTFFNHAGALFNSGETVEATLVANAGTLAPGGSGVIAMTFMENDFLQTGTGVLAIDVAASADDDSDRVEVSNEAVLAGTVAITLTSLPAAAAQTFTILEALSGVTNNGLMLSASPALGASLSFTGTDVILSTSVSFAAVTGLNGNQQAISNTLEQAFAAGSGGLTPVILGLLNTGGLDAYKSALDQLSPEVMSDVQIAALYASLGFANSLLSCKVNGTATASIIREGQCLWAGASAVFLDSGTTAQQIGFDQTAGLFAAGAQVALDNVWRLGVGAGYQSSYLETTSGASSEGEQAQGGVALKYNPGPLLLAGVVSGGRGWYDTTRPQSFGGFSGSARSDSEVDILNGGVRAAYVLGSPQLYVKPVLDAAATYLGLGGFTETGPSAAALSVAGSNQTVTSIAPSFELGTEWWMANGTLVRPYLRGGATWYEGGEFALTAAFLTAPAGVSPFTIVTGMDDVMGLIGAGLDVINGEDTVLHISYDGQLGETTQIHSVGLKGSARY